MVFEGELAVKLHTKDVEVWIQYYAPAIAPPLNPS